MEEHKMKKQYIAPNVQMVKTRLHTMICASGDTLNVTLGGSEGNFGDDNTINSRSGSLWDDEE